MKNELTLKEIKRQDFVDNAIYALIRELNPDRENVCQYDGDYITRIRNIILDYHLFYRSINIEAQPELEEKLAMKFYPFLKDTSDHYRKEYDYIYLNEQ